MAAETPTARYRHGSDTGHTSTDFVLLTAPAGAIRLHKCLTAPRAPAAGALEGLACPSTGLQPLG
ncbi:hypothetical protein JMJ56_13465 [Belnapia sp. T18]|uniref:Uncharacterized protein n=1 Tax=Belnapia arida TaxID=2804533 RepID=A0ABS1U2X0_9PROT|nr:hypothetical protein [Belnapia arida]MBL6079021.1 hypothetical protein [Belnapia arida]